MRYTNPPYPYGSDVPSIDHIQQTFSAFTRVQTDQLCNAEIVGIPWYDVRYIGSARTRYFVENIRQNLEEAGLDIDCIFDRRNLMTFIKTHDDPLDAVMFFKNAVMDFYKFSLFEMDISWNTIDKSHAQVVCALRKWKTGGRMNDTPCLYTFLEIDGDHYFVVENGENESYDTRECDDLPAILSDRIAHVKNCIKYTGNRLFINENLAIVINDLCRVLRNAERMLGI
jgi:hypothetical protein